MHGLSHLRPWWCTMYDIRYGLDYVTWIGNSANARPSTRSIMAPLSLSFSLAIEQDRPKLLPSMSIGWEPCIIWSNVLPHCPFLTLQYEQRDCWGRLINCLSIRIIVLAHTGRCSCWVWELHASHQIKSTEMLSRISIVYLSFEPSHWLLCQSNWKG